MTFNDLPTLQPDRHKKPDWRLTVRFRHGAEDDLIKYLHLVPPGRRATVVRDAVCQSVQSGLTYNDHFNQGSRRHRSDLRVTIRFHHGENDNTIQYLKSLPSRKKSAFVRQALRAALESSETIETNSDEGG